MIKAVATGIVALTVIGSVLVFLLTVAGVVIPVPLRVIALAATGVSFLLCMWTVARWGSL